MISRCLDFRIRSIGLLMMLVTTLSAAPPRPGEIKTYRADGTYQQRLDFMQSMGNDRFSEELTTRARMKLQRLTLEAQGVDPATLGEMAPPPSWQGMPSTGTNKVLCLLVEFSDIVHQTSNTQSMIHQSLFGNGQAVNEPYESLTNYYKRASYNKLTLTGNTLGWYRTAYPRSQVSQTRTGRETLLKEVLNHYAAQGHDFSQYDNDGDGDVDLFYVVYAGQDNGWGNFWWAYQTSFADQNFKIGGKRLGKYVFQFQNYNITDPFTPRVIIHETGHALGLPDYYDYDDTTGPRGGVGGLDMMDANRGDHNCFSKWVLDWLSPTVVSSGSSTVTLRASGTSEDCVMIMPSATANGEFGEYFMLQNRTKSGNDNAPDWPGAGMMIWHIDATLNGTGNDYLYNNSYTAHKLVRLMEADGLEQIETGRGGDAGEFYVAGKSFTVSSTPNSRRYDGTDSKVSITNISNAGSTMTALVSITGSGTPPTVAITSPANNAGFAAGTTVNIQATASDDGSIASVAFYVDGGLHSTDTTAPYSAAWSGGTAGSHILTAVATDNTGATTASAAVTVTITGGTGPANDAFANRTSIVGNNTTVAGTNVGASAEAGEPNHFGRTPAASVWWKWTPNITGTATVSTAGSGFDTILAAYTGASLSTLTELGSNDDSAGLRTSSITFAVTAGVEVMLAVDGYNGASGAISLGVSVAVSSLTNDSFAGAITIATSPARIVSTGTNAGATAETGEPAHFAGNPAATSVWWKWTAPASGSLEVSTQGSGFDTVLAIYTGTAVNALTQRATSDDYFTDRTSWVSIPVTAGTTYRIAVDGFDGASGAINLTTNYIGANLPPVVDFSAPQDGQSFATGEAVELTAEASDPDGTITEVQFRVDGVLIGTRPSVPESISYSIMWTPTAGSHTVMATAVDSGGNTGSKSILVHASTISLEEALDTYGLIWTTGGNKPWYGDDSFSYDAFSAATSGVIGNNETSWCATRVTGPGVLRYRWIVSSEEDYDFLTFYYDGAPQTGKTSGQPGWVQQSWLIPAGVHDVKWEYSKDEAVSAWSDAGWLDQVEWITPPEILAIPPVSTSTGIPFNYQLATLNDDADSYAVTAGTLPPGLSLNTDTGMISGTPGTPGTYNVTFSAQNIAGTGTRSVSFGVISALPLPVAVDTSGLTWTTGGDAAWFGQTVLTHDSVDAARSGYLGDMQSSHAETTIAGPATVSFWWRVDSEQDFDFVRFTIDGVEQEAMSGTQDWQQVSRVLAAGNHTLRWTYAKDETVGNGADTAWLDQLTIGTGSPYSTWAAEKALAGGDADPMADPDRDGLANLIEFALGMEPKSATPDPAALEGSYDSASQRLTLKFRRYPANTDVTLEVQGSVDLTTWTTLARSTAGAATINLGGALSVAETGTGASRTVTVIDGTAGGPAVPKRWLRLRAIQP